MWVGIVGDGLDWMRICGLKIIERGCSWAEVGLI